MGASPATAPVVNDARASAHRRNARWHTQLQRQPAQSGRTSPTQEQAWRADDGRRGSISAAVAAHSVCELDDATICETIEEREHARQLHDYPRADELREWLRIRGVEILDKVYFALSASAAKALRCEVHVLQCGRLCLTLLFFLLPGVRDACVLKPIPRFHAFTGASLAHLRRPHRSAPWQTE